MKITAIKPYAVWVGIRNQLVVKIETDEGIFGWGESGLSGVCAWPEHRGRHPHHRFRPSITETGSDCSRA